MATKKVELKKEPKGRMVFTRKVALAYLGAFGVASDELVKLFNLFVKRGERVEKDVLKFVNQNEKEMRKLAKDIQKQEKLAAARAEKSVKKAVKKVEALAS